jgi:uncharacterized membrane protein
MLDFSVNVTRDKANEPHHRLWKIARLSALPYVLVAGLMQALASELARQTIDSFIFMTAGQPRNIFGDSRII